MGTDPITGAPPTGTGPGVPAPLARRFEAVVFEWEVPGSASVEMRVLVERASEAGLDLVVVTDTPVDAVQGELAVRSPGPGRLSFCERPADEAAAVAGHILADFWARGIDPADVLVASDGFRERTGLLRRAVAVDADPDLVRSVLADQLARRSRLEIPTVDPADEWRVV